MAFRLAGGHLNGMLARAARIAEKDRQRGRKTGPSTCLPIKGGHASVSDLAGPAGIPEVGKKGTIQQARSWEPGFCAQTAQMGDETDFTRCSRPQLTSRPVISKRSTRRHRLQQAWMSSPPVPMGVGRREGVGTASRSLGDKPPTCELDCSTMTPPQLNLAGSHQDIGRKMTVEVEFDATTGEITGIFGDREAIQKTCTFLIGDGGSDDLLPTEVDAEHTSANAMTEQELRIRARPSLILAALQRERAFESTSLQLAGDSSPNETLSNDDRLEREDLRQVRPSSTEDEPTDQRPSIRLEPVLPRPADPTP